MNLEIQPPQQSRLSATFTYYSLSSTLSCSEKGETLCKVRNWRTRVLLIV